MSQLRTSSISIRKRHSSQQRLMNSSTRNRIRVGSAVRQRTIVNPRQRNRQSFSHPSFAAQHEFGSGQWGDSPTVSCLTQSGQELKSSQLDWPKEMGPVLVISIRPERMNQFAQRMGPWMKHMKRFPATDGRTIRPSQWVASRKVVQRNMNAGRMGCYDSHVRIWETVARSAHPVVTVLEDDVDWDYTHAAALLARMTQCFSELKHVRWDWLCWGHGPWAFGKNQKILNLTHWRKPGTCQGFFAYTLTRAMAQRLLTQCYPYKGPAVDKWFYDDFVPRNSVCVLSAEPRMCWVVPVRSDTNGNIRATK